MSVTGGRISITAAGIVNSASYAGGAACRAELANLLLDANGFLSNTFGNTEVLFDGVAAPIIYAANGQASVVVPYQVTGKSTTQEYVSYLGQTSNTISLPVTAAMPGICTCDASGRERP